MVIVLGFLLGGCGVPGEPSASSPSVGQTPTKTSLHILAGYAVEPLPEPLSQDPAGYVLGRLSSVSAKTTCSQHGQSVKISGTVKGYAVTIQIKHAIPYTIASFPPMAGGVMSKTTMTLFMALPKHAKPIRFIAGSFPSLGDAPNGLGVIKISKSGQSGDLELTLVSLQEVDKTIVGVNVMGK